MEEIIKTLIRQRRSFKRRAKYADLALDEVMKQGNGWTGEAASLAKVMRNADLDAAAVEESIRALSAHFRPNRAIGF